MPLDFDPINHVYRFDGKIAMSVTQVIREWVKVKVDREYYYINTFNGNTVRASKFEEAADHGDAVHIGSKLIASGEGVDWSTLDPALVTPLRQFKAWMRDYMVEPVLIESPMYSVLHGYAGTSDIICRIANLKNTLLVVDIKTGGYDMAGPQTAAYEHLYRENHGYKGLVKRYVLHLPKDGKPYLFHEMSNPRDWMYFKSRLFEYQYMRRIM